MQTGTRQAISTTSALVIGFAALAFAAGAAEQAFEITGPRQGARSVLLTWEPEHDVRTLRNTPRWRSALPMGGAHRVEMVSGEGRGGSRAVRLTGTKSAGNARRCTVQELPGPYAPGTCKYQVFYRTTEPEEGCARVVIDCYVGEQRRYHGLVARNLPPAAEWTEVAGEFDLPEDVRLVRCLLYRVGTGTSWFDDVRIHRRGSNGNLLGDGDFEGTDSWRVLFREQGTAVWETVDAAILERFHNVTFLEPETGYEFLVRRVTPSGDVGEESQVLRASTRPSAERVWKALRIGHDVRLATPAAIYPCIESVKGRLYCSESRANTLWLYELNEDFTLKWSKQWVGPFLFDGRPRYQGQSQTAVVGDRIYISWKRQHTWDKFDARQCVASYDTQNGSIGETFVIEADGSGQATWNGGIAALNGRLWASYCLARRTGDGYRTTVTVRTLDYETRKLGPVFELESQPTDTPYTPFLSVFKGELIVCFTDSQSKIDKQPLWLVRFDGQHFHGLMTISPTGFNQYAKGVQVGDRLLLLWKYGAPYPSRIYGRYMFHDIGMAWVDPVKGSIETTSLIDDIKYNSSPDITWHNGRLVFVYNKFEHLYGSREDPAKLYGGFIGTMTPAIPAMP